MHVAPSVSYPSGRSAAAGWLLTVLTALCLGVAGAYCAMADSLGSRQMLVAGLAVTVPVGAWRHWLLTSVGSLRWSGQGWSWQAGSAGSRKNADGEGALHVMLDMQHYVLARWQAPRDAHAGAANRSAVAWLWLERSSAPARWGDLRRALWGPLPSIATNRSGSGDAAIPARSEAAAP